MPPGQKTPEAFIQTITGTSSAMQTGQAQAGEDL